MVVGIEREYKPNERFQRQEGQDDAKLLGLEIKGNGISH